MHIRALVISLAVATLLAFMSAYYAFHHFLHAPLNNKAEIITFTLSPGTGVKAMTSQLQAQGALNSLQAKIFSGWIQYKKAEKSLKAGEYLIPLNITPPQLLAKLIKGDVIKYVITIPEGATFSELLKVLFDHPAIRKTLVGKSHAEIMWLLGEPSLSAEGIFFPDTYYFTANMTDLALLKRARQTMQERLKTAWQNRDSEIIFKTPYEALVLASILEKEAASVQERFLISGVFQRRLAKKMRLQADPTVVYGLKNSFAGNLTKEHLKRNTPYNTYIHKGLPPTPIALPSMISISAALHPTVGAALYFVAKGDGTHHFSVTLQEHNDAVTKYQKSILTND